LSADSKTGHPEIDAEVRRMLGRDSASTSFDYHLLRLLTSLVEILVATAALSASFEVVLRSLLTP